MKKNLLCLAFLCLSISFSWAQIIGGHSAKPEPTLQIAYRFDFGSLSIKPFLLPEKGNPMVLNGTASSGYETLSRSLLAREYVGNYARSSSGAWTSFLVGSVGSILGFVSLSAWMPVMGAVCLSVSAVSFFVGDFLARDALNNAELAVRAWNLEAAAGTLGDGK